MPKAKNAWNLKPVEIGHFISIRIKLNCARYFGNVWSFFLSLFLCRILCGLSFNFIRFSDKSPEIHIVWSKRFFYFLFVFVTLYQWPVSRLGFTHEMQMYTHIQCATKRVKNVLFIHNSMQFHTFFPCGAIPTGSLALWYKPSHPFSHSLSHHKFSTRIIARIHVCLYGHALNVIIFHIRAISHRAIMNWSQIIIHS